MSEPCVYCEESLETIEDAADHHWNDHPTRRYAPHYYPDLLEAVEGVENVEGVDP